MGARWTNEELKEILEDPDRSETEKRMARNLLEARGVDY